MRDFDKHSPKRPDRTRFRTARVVAGAFVVFRVLVACSGDNGGIIGSPEAGTDASLNQSSDDGPGGSTADTTVSYPDVVETGNGDIGTSPDMQVGDDADAALEDVGLDGDSSCSDDSACGDAPLSTDAEGGMDQIADGGSDALADTGGDADGGLSGDADGGPGGDADGGLSATAALVLAARNAACLACAQQNHCLDTGSICDSLAGQNASAGPDAGESKEQLCLDALSCFFSSYCFEAASDLEVCICGPESPQTCKTSGPILDAGAQCAAQEQAGLETTSATTELQVQTTTTLGAGMAGATIECISNAQCVDCL
jgi:hypothetical protein